MTLRLLTTLLLVAHVLLLSPVGAQTKASVVPSKVQSNALDVESSPQAKKAALTKILARREYKGTETSWSDRATRHWWRGFLKWLNRHSSERVASAAGVFAEILAVIVVLVLLVLIGYALSLIGRRARFGDKVPKQAKADIYIGPDTSKGALDEAAKLAGSGDFRSALRLVYLAALLRLDDANLIRFDRTGTNWEYLALLRAKPDVYNLLRPVTITFDRKWYGHEPATEADYSIFMAVYKSLESVEVAK